MSQNSPNSELNPSNRVDQAGHEETLRLLAELPPPAELTERVHRRIAEAQVTPERRGFWSLWLPAQRFQFAAAAALMIAVAGSTWSLYHRHPQAGTARQNPAPAPQQSAPASASHFDNAGAMRVPPTLKPIPVQRAPKKKPSASHAAAKPSPKVLAAQP
jgi:hypothetical protein